MAFDKMAQALRDTMQLLQNINHPNPQKQKLIKEFLGLVFNQNPETITFDTLKNKAHAYISCSPYITIDDESHTKIVLYWGTASNKLENLYTPLHIDVVVPEDKWLHNGQVRALLILNKIMQLIHLENVSSIGQLELLTATPTTIQQLSGYSMLFITTQNE